MSSNNTIPIKGPDQKRIKNPESTTVQEGIISPCIVYFESQDMPYQITEAEWEYPLHRASFLVFVNNDMQSVNPNRASEHSSIGTMCLINDSSPGFCITTEAQGLFDIEEDINYITKPTSERPVKIRIHKRVLGLPTSIDENDELFD